MSPGITTCFIILPHITDGGTGLYRPLRNHLLVSASAGNILLMRDVCTGALIRKHTDYQGPVWGELVVISTEPGLHQVKEPPELCTFS